MSLTSRQKNKIIDTINTTLASIGYANGMRMPKSDDNREPAAWKMWVAYYLASRVQRYKEEAEAEAAEAGIIPDKLKNPQEPGKHGTIYRGNSVTIALEVRNPGTRIDAKKMVEWLEAAGVNKELLQEAVRMATSTSRGAHVFSPMLNSEVDFGK